MQIVHTLRTGGADYDDIDEISLAVPCLEMAHDYGYSDLQADQPGAFRAYKTHFTREQCPHGEGVKYIIVVRDPAEVRFCATQLCHSPCRQKNHAGLVSEPHT